MRKDYSANSDIWRLRRVWELIKVGLLAQLDDGSYTFGLLDRYEFDDATITLWSSQDMIVSKLMTQALAMLMTDHIPKSCYHVSGHGGLKKAVHHTHDALSEHRYVMCSDIKGYYMDDQKILPSKETIRRFHERSTALYEPSQGNRNVSHQHKRNPHERDISEYQFNEPASTEKDVQSIFTQLSTLAAIDQVP